MNKVMSALQKYATPGYAFLMFALLLAVGQILAMVDRPLIALAHGSPKLDLRPGYDLVAVQQLFDAYGETGRALYAWDIVVDMLYPFSQALTAILFILLVVRRPVLQKVLIAFPLAFLALDLLENVFFLRMIAAYPSISSNLVDLASMITRVKRFSLLMSYYELFVFMLVTLFLLVKRLLAGKGASSARAVHD